MKVNIHTNYLVGEQCKEFLKVNLPPYWEYTDEPDESDVYISILSQKLIKKDFIDKRQCFNFHVGILPMYGGTGIIPQVIINGEKECGITLHRIIDDGIDNGDIIDIRKFEVLPDDTGDTLFQRAIDNVFEMFKMYGVRLLLNQWWSAKQEEPVKLYYKKDMEKLKDITPIIRAFTFEGKENAYWLDSNSHKQYVKYE